MKPRSSGGRWRYSNPAFLLAVFVLIAAIGRSYADEVDDYVNRQMRRQHVAGLSLAVVKNGKLIRAYQIDHNFKDGPNNLFEI